MGLIPCNVIPDEILTDHPKRFRAMWIESSNPVHSLADSPRMRAALRHLECSVVVDVAMTETALQADYVLPASSQFEKAEATFFNLEFPKNGFHLRQPLFAPRAGTLSEAEIHARLVEAMAELKPQDYTGLKCAARFGYTAFGLYFAYASSRKTAQGRALAKYAPVVMYRTLGAGLPASLAHFAPAASLWGLSQMFVRTQARAAAAAGFSSQAWFLKSLFAGNKLFKAMLNSSSGFIFSISEYADSWKAVRLPNQKLNLHIPEMLQALRTLDAHLPPKSTEFPFVLSAGERRSDTSNTSIRNPEWQKKHALDAFGALRLNAQDALDLGCVQGDWVKITTKRGAAQAQIEITDTLQSGHISLPNGHGIDYATLDGSVRRYGVSLNELTNTEDRDAFAGTPWHKYVPARLEKVA